MGGQKMQGPFEPHDTPGPLPSITVEEFREQFTEEIRRSILMAIEKAMMSEKAYWISQAMSEEDAYRLARSLFQPARRGQQLIGFLAPGKYLW